MRREGRLLAAYGGGGGCVKAREGLAGCPLLHWDLRCTLRAGLAQAHLLLLREEKRSGPLAGGLLPRLHPSRQVAGRRRACARGSAGRRAGLVAAPWLARCFRPSPSVKRVVLFPAH